MAEYFIDPSKLQQKDPLDTILKGLTIAHTAYGIGEAKTKADEFLMTHVNEKSADTFKKSLADSDAKVVETSLEALDSQKADFISSTEEAFSLYSLTTDKPVYNKVLDKGGAYYVVMLAEKKEPNGEDYAKKRAEILAAQSQKVSSRLLDSLVAALRAESTIEINPSILSEGA